MSHFNKQNSSFSIRNQNTSYDNKPFSGNNRFSSKEKYPKMNSDNRQNFNQNTDSRRPTKFEQQNNNQAKIEYLVLEFVTFVKTKDI